MKLETITNRNGKLPSKELDDHIISIKMKERYYKIFTVSVIFYGMDN